LLKLRTRWRLAPLSVSAPCRWFRGVARPPEPFQKGDANDSDFQQEESTAVDGSKPNERAIQDALKNIPGRTSLDRACTGYDPAFERALVNAIGEAIALASITTDKNVMALRTGETIAALATCMAATLACVSDADVPSRLREMVNQLARRIRRDAAKARAKGLGDIFGAVRGGHA
jgi:hypothetical protein